FDVVRFEDQASDTSPFVITSTGNVGIGITNPSQKLDVQGAVRLGANGGTNDILNTSAAGGAPSGVLYWGSRQICDDSGNCSGAGGGVTTTGGTQNFLAKFSGSQTIENSAIYETGGLVGIGTTNPLTSLHVAGRDSQGRA